MDVPPAAAEEARADAGVDAQEGGGVEVTALSMHTLAMCLNHPFNYFSLIPSCGISTAILVSDASALCRLSQPPQGR